MKRNLMMLIGLFIFAIGTPGCRTAGQGHLAQPFNQGFAQPTIQQQISGNGYQQQGFPEVQQAQQVLGGLGRNLGSRLSNNLINRGVNHLAEGLFSAL